MICYPIFFLIIEDKTYLFEKKKTIMARFWIKFTFWWNMSIISFYIYITYMLSFENNVQNWFYINETKLWSNRESPPVKLY